MLTNERLTKLSKILALTTSDTDGEALAAIRTANKILASENLTWPQFLSLVNVGPTAGGPDPEVEDDDWDSIIGDLLIRKSLNPRARDFLESVLSQYRYKGSLSQKQEAAVRKFMGAGGP